MASNPQTPVTLVFRADFGADPLWRHVAGRGPGMVRLDRLPLSAQLTADVRAWARRHDELQDPPNPVRGTPAELGEWVRTGSELLVRLRAELGPRFEVVDGRGGSGHTGTY
ncbi:hypothetical protein AB2L27_13940 [Kineococcus sp. LSe6-4]|uniref:Uncharacterized protein n=1 Tax=Kineococcus halophytocola TaxID=3234027 RepID=A0ABV4H2Q3_9ACTN